LRHNNQSISVSHRAVKYTDISTQSYSRRRGNWVICPFAPQLGGNTAEGLPTLMRFFTRFTFFFYLYWSGEGGAVINFTASSTNPRNPTVSTPNWEDTWNKLILCPQFCSWHEDFWVCRILHATALDICRIVHTWHFLQGLIFLSGTEIRYLLFYQLNKLN
jgi:hypothetical protein